jgi:hypothetical protein
MLPDGTWVSQSTASKTEWDATHIPIHRNSGPGIAMWEAGEETLAKASASSAYIVVANRFSVMPGADWR